MRQAPLAITLFLFLFMVALSVAQVPAQRIESQSGFAWVMPEVKALRVSFHTFESDAAKGKVSYHIYKPAAYDREGQRRLPVIYWLHGSGGGLDTLGTRAFSCDGKCRTG